MKKQCLNITERHAAIIKGMLARGDLQHEVAAFFRVNQGRVSEINTNKKFYWVPPASPEQLPPPL